MSKADYVRGRATGDPGGHHCHWPGCERAVPPAMWGCKPHWFALPPGIRSRIWATFRPGQEESKTPSEAYVKAVRDAEQWIEGGGGGGPVRPSTQGRLL